MTPKPAVPNVVDGALKSGVLKAFSKLVRNWPLNLSEILKVLKSDISQFA